jgi:surface antigen
MLKKTLAIAAAGLFAGTTVAPAIAQPYGPPPPPPGYYGPPPPPPGDYAAYRDRYGAYDPYWRECQRQRSTNTAGGAIIGALAGGLFGNAVSGRHSEGAGTLLGALAGGAVGAGIGNSLSCEQRGYAYRAYYRGLASGRPGRYDWRGPNGRARGYLDVNSYWVGRNGERCANYDQTVFVNGRPEYDRGYACQQPDGAWAFFG